VSREAGHLNNQKEKSMTDETSEIRSREDFEREIFAPAGTTMTDCTVYAGSLQGRDIYTTRGDEPGTYGTIGAELRAERLNKKRFLGHADWRVPTKSELNVLFNNRAAIGGFDEGGSEQTGWYRSSTGVNDYGSWVQRFSDGDQLDDNMQNHASLRLVR
jgi:Protein of unknown function (DUF1566)